MCRVVARQKYHRHAIWGKRRNGSPGLTQNGVQPPTTFGFVTSAIEFISKIGYDSYLLKNLIAMAYAVNVLFRTVKGNIADLKVGVKYPGIDVEEVGVKDPGIDEEEVGVKGPRDRCGVK
eukprot:sb/3476150/